MKRCFFGTYLSDGGEGIYKSMIDTEIGTLTTPELLCPAKNSKYLICEGNKIFTTFDGEYSSGVAVYSDDGVLIDSIEYENSTSCYILKDGNFIYTANYHEGSITKLQFVDNKLAIVGNYIVQPKSGCHQVIIVDQYIFVPCLLLDQIYVFDKNLEKIKVIDFPKQSGPRHGVKSVDQNYLYIVGELSDSLYTINMQGEILHTLPLLPKNICENVRESAAIRMSKDGKTLMISIRTANIIVMVDISKETPQIIQHISANGDHPRDILNVVDDKYLLVANRLSGNVVSMKLKDNKIIDQCAEIKVAGVVTIGIMED